MARTAVLELSAVKTARGFRPTAAERFDCFRCDESIGGRVVEIKSKPIVNAEERNRDLVLHCGRVD